MNCSQRSSWRVGLITFSENTGRVSDNTPETYCELRQVLGALTKECACTQCRLYLLVLGKALRHADAQGANNVCWEVREESVVIGRQVEDSAVGSQEGVLQTNAQKRPETRCVADAERMFHL